MTQDEADVVTKLSPHPVADTVSKLTGILSAKGIRLFAVIDQSAEARQAGLSLRDTTLVIFGNPAAGTPVMVAAPLAALDLPLALTKRAMLIAVRNSQPTAPSFLAEASERLNKRMAARSSRNGSRHISEPWIR